MIMHRIAPSLTGLGRSLRTVAGLLALLSGGILALDRCTARTAADPANGKVVFDDPLESSEARPAGSALAGLTLSDPATAWKANKGVILTGHGATASVPSGAHHAIPKVAGTVRLQATVCATGSGFTGLALGRGDLSGNFWKNCEILFYAQTKRCGLMVGGQDVTSLMAPASTKLASPTNRLDLSVNTLTRLLTLRVNDTVVLDNAPLPPQSKVNNLTAAGFRFNEPVTAEGPLVSGYHAEVANIATADLDPDDLGMVFITPGTPATLRWKAGVRGQSGQAPCILRDYTGEDAIHTNATCGADGIVTLTRTFAQGYHEVEFPEANQTFGILALPPCTGPGDRFFGLDAGLTWLEKRPDVRTNLVAIMKRSGITVVRERLNLRSINPRPGLFKWEEPEMLRNLYRKAGIELLDSLWGDPAHLEPGTHTWYPKNLVETATLWSLIVSRFGGCWGAYEIGNEPDVYLPAMPADQYVAVVKAGAFASDRITPRPPVVGGVFATVPPGSYFDSCHANGLFDTIDAMSFHQYDRAPALQGQIQAYRDFLIAIGKPGLPLWLTECGHPWKLGPDRPPCDQDRDSAREISAKAIEARACGVRSYFPFIMTFYEEGGSKSFSMFGREVTPLRSFAAYAWCVSTLSGRDYCGDLRTDDPAIRRARGFTGKDGSLVVAVYSDTLDPHLRVRLPLAPQRVTGADGRELPVGTDGTMPLPDALGYAWFPGSQPDSILTRDTPAAHLLAASRHAAPERVPAAPLVLQFTYTPDQGQISKRAYHVSKANAADLPITVRLQNMGDSPLTVTPVLHLPGREPRRIPHDTIRVNPRTITNATWRVDASAALDICEVRHVRITATCEQAPGILPLALPVLVDGELPELLARFPKQVPLPIADTSRWKVRTGHGKQVFSSPGGKTWRMDMTFSNIGNAWAYPYFTLPAPIDPKTFTGIVLRARVAAKASNNMLTLVDTKNSREIRAEDLYVADGQWHSVYVPFNQLRYFTPGMQNEPLHLDLITTLSVGLCSRTLTNTLEVSDLILVGD